MRIRKPHRNARREENAVPIAGPLLKGWDAGDGGPKSTTTTSSTSETETGIKTTAAAAVMELASGLESASPERSRPESPSPGVSTMPQGSNLSMDQLWQTDAEHATRHYVRRSNVARSKPGDAPAPARMSPLVKKPINGNEGSIKEGESEELPSAIGASTKSKWNNPLRRTDDSEADSEDHPSTAPEGSLLHTLYLQLLAAGSEGITLRELFTSFKKQTALPSLGFDWKEQVRSHLRNNPQFDDVKGHYLLKCVQQQQQPKRKPAATVTLNRPYMCVSPRTTKTSATRHVRTTVQSTESSAPAAGLPVEKPEGVQTRRKAYEKTIEAVLTESAMEFERMQQMAASSVSTRAAAAAASNFVTAEATDSQVPTMSSRKRKASSLISAKEELEGCKTIRGSLQAMQAKILAATGVQKGVPCARKDDARKWRCPLMAMEGHTLCEHHKTLQLRKRAKKQEVSKSRRSSAEEDTKLGVTNPRTQGSVPAEEAETCSTEKEDNVGGAHAVEALVHLQGQRTVRSSNTAEAIKGDDDAAAATLNPVKFEEADSEVVINDHLATKTSRTPAATDHGSDTPLTAVDEPPAGPVHIHYEKAIPGSLKALQAKILAESGVRSGVRCARKDGSNDSARKWQCPLDAMEGHTLCEHHNFLKERKRARYAAAKQTNTPGARKRRRHDTGSNNATQQLDQAPASLPPRSELTPLNKASENDHVESRTRSRAASDEKSDHAHSVDTDDVDHSNVEPANGKNSKENDDNNVDDANHGAERLLPHIFKNAPKRWYVAAKKSAANVEAVKEQSQERETSSFVRPPTIPPLPAMYGIRRKAVKNRSLLSL